MKKYSSKTKIVSEDEEYRFKCYLNDKVQFSKSTGVIIGVRPGASLFYEDVYIVKDKNGKIIYLPESNITSRRKGKGDLVPLSIEPLYKAGDKLFYVTQQCQVVSVKKGKGKNGMDCYVIKYENGVKKVHETYLRPYKMNVDMPKKTQTDLIFN